MSAQRIHLGIRWGAFALSTFALSIFFAGWRAIHESNSWSGYAILLLGVVSTLSLLVLQGYWIYFEEKNKGAVRHGNRFYDWLHAAIEARCAKGSLLRLIQPIVVVQQEGIKQ